MSLPRAALLTALLLGLPGCVGYYDPYVPYSAPAPVVVAPPVYAPPPVVVYPGYRYGWRGHGGWGHRGWGHRGWGQGGWNGHHGRGGWR